MILRTSCSLLSCHKERNVYSMLLLGDIYMEGVGMEQDMAKAKAWYEKAKAAENDEAEQRLADLS